MNYLHEGNRLWSRDEYPERAEAAFREALRLQPDSAAAARGLAKVLRKQNRHEEIVRGLAEMAQRLGSPSLLGLVAEAADFLVYHGREEYLEMAISLQRDLLTLHLAGLIRITTGYAYDTSGAAIVLGNLLSFKAERFDEALAAYRIAWPEHAGSKNYRKWVARCLKRKGRAEEAGRVLLGEEPVW